MKFTRHPVAAAVSLLWLAAATNVQAQASAGQSVEITGIRASLEKSIATKRDAASNVEVVTAEDVGKMPDKNIADALSRVPGLNVQFGGALAMDEAERIAIRGTSPNLNLTTVSGHALASGDWHVGDQNGAVRSVGFGLLPSQLIGRAIVYKTGQADITEGGIAGTVDIQLRKPLDFRNILTGEVSLGLVHATMPKATDPQAAGLIAWKNADSTLGLMAQIYKERRHLRRDGQETFSFNNVAANSATGIANPALVGLRMPGSLNSALFEGLRDREGGYLGVQFKPTKDSELYFSAFKSTLKADNYNSSAFALPGTLVNQGANGYLIQNPVIQGDVITSATLVRNPASPATYRVMGMQFDHNQRQGAESTSEFYDLEGKFKVSNDFSVKGRVGVTKGQGITESQPSLFFGLINPNMRYTINTSRPTDYVMLDPATGNPIDLSKTSSFSLLQARPAAVAAFDEQSYLHLDGEWRFNKGFVSALKFGARAGKHERNYEFYNSRWNVEDQPNFPGFTAITAATLVTNFITPTMIPTPATAYPANYASGLDANFPRQLFRFDQSQLSAFAAQNLNWNKVGNRLWTNSYTVEEKTNAVYAMADLDWGDLTGNAGVRFVQTKVYSVAYQALPAATCAILVPCAVPGAIVGSRNHTALAQVVETTHEVALPSMNLRYKLAGGHILRGSLSKTMGRPNYGELAGAVSLDNLRLTGSSGNPKLKPITSTNADLSWAWYFKPQSYVMAAAFYQDLKDYVKAGTSQVEFFNTNTLSNSVYTLTSRYGVKARIRGVEAAMDMPVAAGFGVGANVTYVDGKDQDGVELLGTSKTTANLIGWYENDKFSARMAWNQRSDYAIGFIGNGTNTPNNGVHKYKGSGTLSLSLGYKITEKLSVTFDGNILNDPVRHTYYLTENAPGYWHQSGRQYFLNLRAKI